MVKIKFIIENNNQLKVQSMSAKYDNQWTDITNGIATTENAIDKWDNASNNGTVSTSDNSAGYGAKNGIIKIITTEYSEPQPEPEPEPESFPYVLTPLGTAGGFAPSSNNYDMYNLGVSSKYYAITARDVGSILFYTTDNGRNWYESNVPTLNADNYSGQTISDNKMRQLSISRNGKYSVFMHRLAHGAQDFKHERWYSNYYISSDYGANYTKPANTGSHNNRGYNFDTNDDVNDQNIGFIESTGRKFGFLISNDGNTIITARSGWGVLYIKTSGSNYWKYLNKLGNGHSYTSLAGNANLTKIYATATGGRISIYDTSVPRGSNSTPYIKQTSNWQNK